MSLRRLTFLLIAITTLGLVGVVLINITRILRNHFEGQEKNSVYLNIKQVKNALDQQITFLDNTSNDWANWDETYNFIETGDAEYIDNNLQPITYQNLDLDLFILVNNQFKVVYGGVISTSGRLSNLTPPEIINHLNANDLFLSNSNDLSIKHGLISINNQPMMIISHPILKSDGSGPSHGTLLLGKYISREVLGAIENLLSLSVEIHPIAAVQNIDEYIMALSFKPTEKDPYYVNLTDNDVNGYAVLNDIFDQPAMIMHLKRYPTIYNNGILVNNYLVISVVTITVTFTTLLYLLIEFYVLNRVRQLSHDVQAIGTSGDINKRLLVRRKDELSLLASQINDMLGALERANLQQRESEDRFRTLVESMEDVVFTVEPARKKIHVYEKKSSPEEPLPTGKLPNQAELLQADLKNELVIQQKSLDRSFLGESTIIEWTSRSANRVRNFITTLSPIYGTKKDIISVVGVSKDITEQKKLERDLRNHVNELGALFNISQQLLSEIKEDTIHEVICRLAVEQIGMDAAWICVPSPDGSSLNPTASYGIQLETLAAVELVPSAQHPLHPAAEAYQQKKLRLFPYHLTDPGTPDIDPEEKSAAAIPLIQSELTLAVLVIIKQKEPYIQDESLPLIYSFVNLASMAMQNAYLFKQVLNGRERLQSISRRLVDVQEEERRGIALELHDEIGQILTGLRLSMDMLHTLPKEKAKKQVQLSVEVINDLIDRVRQMSLRLRPSMLDDLGIIPTLIWYIDRYTSQTGIQVNFQHNNLLEKRFSPDIEITVFRVVQEALTNVARYAKVQTANVRLWRTEKVIGVQIEDEGAGFNQDLVFNSHESKGLLGMRERVGFLQGALSIVTQPGEGACLTAEIPLEGFIERRRNDRTGSLGR